MKIMITILRKNGDCRTWTNSTAEGHLVMGATAYVEGAKRCAESWGIEKEEVEKVLKRSIWKVRNKSMNVLEKILEEIEKEKNSYEADHAWNYSKGLEYAAGIIRSHMADVPE